MGKRAEYRRMMRAIKDLDRVDAGQAPKERLQPGVGAMTDRWVTYDPSKLPTSQGSVTDIAPTRRRRRLLWWLIALAAAVALAASIPAVRDHGRGLFRAAAKPVPHRLRAAVTARTTGAYAFLATQPRAPHATGPAQPVTYSPCQPIRYQINADEAPAGSAGLITEGVLEVERLTGLDFVYAGRTHGRPAPQQRVLVAVDATSFPPVQIVWARPAELKRLSGDVLGYAGSAQIKAPSGVARYITGQVALDAPSASRLLSTAEGRATVEAVILHELGHLVGLAHVKDRAELMYPEVGQLRDFGPGDRAGLAQLGRGSCR